MRNATSAPIDPPEGSITGGKKKGDWTTRLEAKDRGGTDMSYLFFFFFFSVCLFLASVGLCSTPPPLESKYGLELWVFSMIFDFVIFPFAAPLTSD